MAVSVLPTPLGPTSRNTPIGRRGSVRLARAVRMRWAIASRACDWPMTRSSSFVLEVQHRLDLVGTILPTGMPVQPATTSATAWRVDQTCISGDLALELAQLGGPGVELGLRAGGSSSGSAGLPSPLGLRLGVRASRACRARSLDLLDQALLLVPALLQLGQPRLRPSSLLGHLVEPLVVVGAGGGSRARGCRARRRGARSRGGSPRRPAGSADWPIATRAQAVSSRLTDLSGSWRSVM